jgi:hypothetical protein
VSDVELTLTVDEPNVIIAAVVESMDISATVETGDVNVVARVLDDTIITAVLESTDVLVDAVLGVSGPIGATGPQGPTGPTGPPGPLSGTYTHDQSIPSDTWTIIHNLGYFPNVTVVDSGGTEVEGNVNYSGANTVIVSFSAAFSGKAYLT